jgi:hypothetical protein
LVSCKKNDIASKPACKIASFTSGTDATIFTYNSIGQEGSIITSTLSKFIYSSNTIKITNTTGSTINTLTTDTLNANGLASNTTVKDTTGVDTNKGSYNYNGSELSRVIFTASGGGVPDPTNYTWSGGNMISSQNHSMVTTFECPG